jgi:hypothetical protein
VRRLLYLEADQGVLERTVRDDQIVTGPFGAIVVVDDGQITLRLPLRPVK